MKEVIIATNSSLEEETTAMYISKLMRDPGSGLAVLPVECQNDEVTLLRALEGRVEL